MHLPFTHPWWRFFMTNGTFYLIQQKMLYHPIYLIVRSFTIAKKSSMTHWSNPATSQYCFIIYLVSLKSSLNVDSLSSPIECVGHALILDGNFPAQSKFYLFLNGFSHHMVYHFSLLLASVHSTIIMSHGLNQI